MENTLENKAKFFAFYWGQKVFKSSINQDVPHKNTFGKSIRHNDFLELKPISSISDEDAHFLGYSDAKSATTTYFKTLGKNTNDADYLRSRGYALPWMWLSVEELVRRGWVKLKGETK